MLKSSSEKAAIFKICVIIFTLFVSLGGCCAQSGKPSKITYTSNPRKIDLWHLAIAHQIRDNWVFNKNLQELNQNLKIIILLKVTKNGSLQTARFEERSGNKTLDEHAMAVVKKSAPFPPLPKGKEVYNFGIIFSPKGLK